MGKMNRRKFNALVGAAATAALASPLRGFAQASKLTLYMGPPEKMT